MRKPLFASLFQLSDPVSRRPYRGKFEPFHLGVGLSRGEAKCNHPVQVRWAMGGTEPGDLIWTTAAHPLIAHARVIDLFERNRFTGWAAYPAEVFSKVGTLLHDYVGLTITGRCDRVDLTRSKVVLHLMPGGWVPRFLGHYFTPDSWDGSDLFMERPDVMGQISMIRFISEPVKHALASAKVKNLVVTPLNELSVDCGIYTNTLRHLLPSDFEEKVARAYRDARVDRPDWV